MMTADEFYQDVRGALTRLYPGAYLTSWSGAELHDLTASAARDYVLFSAAFEEDGNARHYNQLVTLKKIPMAADIGLVRIPSPAGGFMAADVHRTVIDMLYDPVLAGGDEIINEAWDNYFARTDADFNTLCRYAETCGMQAVLTALKERGGR